MAYTASKAANASDICTATGETPESGQPATRGLVVAVLLSVPVWLAGWMLVRML